MIFVCSVVSGVSSVLAMDEHLSLFFPQHINKWFYRFISYVIAYKANIAKEGYYGTVLSDKKVQEL